MHILCLQFFELQTLFLATDHCLCSSWSRFVLKLELNADAMVPLMVA
jgi:hypothetical protein